MKLWIIALVVVLAGCAVKVSVVDERVSPEKLQNVINQFAEKINAQGEALKILTDKMAEKNKK